MSPKTATSFLFIVLITSLITGCSQNQEPVTSEPTMGKTAWLKDGDTYTFEASYDNSAGTSEDTFSVTLDEQSVVTAAEATPKVQGGKHSEGIARFNADLAPAIVGKNLSEIGEFDTLGQYSLTTTAFNEALKQLQEEVEANS